MFEKAEELSDMLLKSDVYNRFIIAKEKISADEDLMNRIDEYRRKNFTLQNSTSNNKIDELRELEDEYRDTLKNTVVREYLNSELILCRTIQNINDIIIDRIDFDVKFI